MRELKKAHGIVDSVENSEDEDGSCHSGRAGNNESREGSKAEAEELISNKQPGVGVERLQDTPSLKNNSNIIQPILIKEDAPEKKEE